MSVLCLADVEGEIVVLALHCKVSDLNDVGDQAYYRCAVGKLNDGVGVVLGHAVVGEQGVQEGIKHTPLRCPGL